MQEAVTIVSGALLLVIPIAAYSMWWRQGDRAGALEVVTIGLVVDVPVFAGSLYTQHLLSFAAKLVVLALLGVGIVANAVGARLRWQRNGIHRERRRAIAFLIVFNAFILTTMVSVVAPDPIGGPM